MEEFQVVVTPVSNEQNFSSQHKLIDDDSQNLKVDEPHYSSNESVNSVSGSPTASPVSRRSRWAKIKRELIVNKKENSSESKKKSDVTMIPKSPVPSSPIFKRAVSSSPSFKGARKEFFSNEELTPVKILVLGQDGVGKSAFIVRYLTGKYIGEYDPCLEGIFKRKKMIKSKETIIEIKDTIGGVNWLKRTKDLIWADILILVYSTTDRNSFNAVDKVSKYISRKQLERYIFMVIANKKDLTHQRTVNYNEGYHLSQKLNASFIEVSVAEDYRDIEIYLNKLCLEFIMTKKVLQQQSLLVSRSSPDLKNKFHESSRDLNNNQDTNFLTVGYASYNNSATTLTDNEDSKSEKRGRALWQKLKSNSELRKQKK